MSSKNKQFHPFETLEALLHDETQKVNIVEILKKLELGAGPSIQIPYMHTLIEGFYTSAEDTVNSINEHVKGKLPILNSQTELWVSDTYISIICYENEKCSYRIVLDRIGTDKKNLYRIRSGISNDIINETLDNIIKKSSYLKNRIK